MDFADATPEVLAEETGINEMLTLDFRGFSAYRLHGKKSFNLQPR
jgi:predicted nucleic acid-binding protein